jgi:hypothetical protein
MRFASQRCRLSRMAWFGKYRVVLCGLFLSALYIYLQLVVWKKHGDDLMLTTTNIVVTCSLWTLLLIAIVRYWWRDAHAVDDQKCAIDARPITATEIFEIGFGYLPGSPLSPPNLWKRAYGDVEAVPSFGAPPDPPGAGGLSMAVTKKYAMDYALPPKAQLADELELAIKYDAEAMFYVCVDVTSADGSLKDQHWINIRLGQAPPRQLKDYLKEYLVYVTPERLGNGWVRMRLRLPEIVNAAMGCEGLFYDSVKVVRLRGCISVSPIKFFSPSREVGLSP